MPMAAGAELRFLRLLGTSHTVGGICKERTEAVCESGGPFLLTFLHLAGGRLVNFSMVGGAQKMKQCMVVWLAISNSELFIFRNGIDDDPQ